MVRSRSLKPTTYRLWPPPGALDAPSRVAIMVSGSPPPNPSGSRTMRRHLLAASIAVGLVAAGCGSSQTAEGHAPGCDSCHAFPAATASHASAPGGSWEATDCNACHPTSVNTAGAIVPTAASGTHINGTVEAGHGDYSNPLGHGPAADTGIAACTSCH